MNENLDLSLKEFNEKDNFNNYMTSELIYLCMIYQDKDEELFKKMFTQVLKRLKYCGCTQEMNAGFFRREKFVLNNSDSALTKIPTLKYPIKEENLGICGYNWWDDYKSIFPNGIENGSVMDFTISEIVSITYRAEYLVLHEPNNKAISDDLFKEIYLLSEIGNQSSLLEQLYKQLTTQFGWEIESMHKFFANEFAIVRKYRYGEDEKPFGEE